MENKNKSTSGIFLLIIYFILLVLDLCFLSKTSYHIYRAGSKPIQMIFLAFWFHKNTAMGIGIPPNSFFILFCTYAMLFLLMLSDFCGISGWNHFLVHAYYFLYIPIYFLYFLLLIGVVRSANEEKRVVFYVKKIVPAFVLVLVIGIMVLWKAVGFGTEYYHWFFYLHAFIIALMSAAAVNIWGLKQLAKSPYLFVASVAFIILTNTTYCFDELYYHRRHHFLDILVALGNGTSIILMLFGVINVLRNWKNLEQ